LDHVPSLKNIKEKGINALQTKKNTKMYHHQSAAILVSGR
jgi:hypothetical protein